MKVLFTFFLLITISSNVLSQVDKNSIIVEGITFTFGISESEFSGINSKFEKTGDVYQYSITGSSENSSLIYQFKFSDDKLVEFFIYTHWPNEEQLEIFENIVKQFKTTKTEEDEGYTTKHLKKDKIRGYALYSENATLELWDTRYIKK